MEFIFQLSCTPFPTVVSQFLFGCGLTIKDLVEPKRPRVDCFFVLCGSSNRPIHPIGSAYRSVSLLKDHSSSFPSLLDIDSDQVSTPRQGPYLRHFSAQVTGANCSSRCFLPNGHDSASCNLVRVRPRPLSPSPSLLLLESLPYHDCSHHRRALVLTSTATKKSNLSASFLAIARQLLTQFRPSTYNFTYDFQCESTQHKFGAEHHCCLDGSFVCLCRWCHEEALLDAAGCRCQPTFGCLLPTCQKPFRRQYERTSICIPGCAYSCSRKHLER